MYQERLGVFDARRRASIRRGGREGADDPTGHRCPVDGVVIRRNAGSMSSTLVGPRKSLRKEVIQPQVLLRLPCYDLVPVTELAVGTPEIGRLRALPASMT